MNSRQILCEITPSECESWHRMQRRQWLVGTSMSFGGIGLTSIAESRARASDAAREKMHGSNWKNAPAMIVVWLQGDR